VIGLGQVGRAVAQRGKAFGMKVIGWSRSLTREQAEEMGIVYCESPLEVARSADVVTLHIASTPETRHLVNEEFFAAMKPGSYLINTTRGAVVDEQALSKAIREKGIRAGLDVYEHEPDAGDNTFRDEIVREGGVCGTHHVGASTEQAQDAIAAETVRIVESYLRSGDVPNCVNRAASSPATCLLTVRHLNRTGVLAHVFHVLSDGGINVEEMENIIYDGAKAACARIQLDDRPTGGQLDAIARNVNILSVDLADRSS
jgi:D-3-phosphoglycerate dehydrogenase